MEADSPHTNESDGANRPPFGNLSNFDSPFAFLKNARILAPLVGGSDLSYRLTTRHYGAQVTYTEMCIADYYLNSHTKQVKNYTFEFDPTDRPLIAQLAGNTSQPIIELANSDLFKGHIDAVDINCGCPQSFAMDKGYGAALLKNPSNLVDICRDVVANVKYPVSVKLRLESSVEHTMSIVSQLYNIGIRAFTVHGRYQWQKGEFRGRADWEAIREIRRALPSDCILVGNGDIEAFPQFIQFQELYHVDAAMAGYGALLNPSLFQEQEVDVSSMISTYLSKALPHHNLFIDILRHIGWMVKRHTPSDIKSTLFECTNLFQVQDVLARQPKPIHITIPTVEKDRTRYSTSQSLSSMSVNDMSTKQRKKYEKQQQKKSNKHAERTKIPISSSSASTSSDDFTDLFPAQNEDDNS